MRTENRTRVKEVILATVGLAGLVTLAVLAPNAVQLLKYVIKNDRQRQNRLYYVKSVAKRMADSGSIAFAENQQGQKVIRLTKKGQEELKHYQQAGIVIPKPAKWDGKFRLIIFDIKEWKRNSRDELRQWLVNLGFIRLQNSVWAYPYECREVIVLLKANFRLGKEVLYLTADYLENDGWLKKSFGLT
ncbi:MAG: CRISPR-associated endonuclease Cas2 [Candidatus Vogelbacteria bacterium]